MKSERALSACKHLTLQLNGRLILKEINMRNLIMIEEFIKLKKAYDILNDVEARASYDTTYEAKRKWEKKERKLSDKRQMMINNLKEKENASNQDQNAKSQHEDNVQR